MTTSGVIAIIAAAGAGALLIRWILARGGIGVVTQNALDMLRKRAEGRVQGAEALPDNTPVPEEQVAKEELPNESSSSKLSRERAGKLLKRQK